MRFLSFLVLVVVLGAVGLFALQNQQEITLRFWDRDLTFTVAIFAAAVYLLGMISGWSIVGLLRRSLWRVTAPTGQR